MAHGGRKPGKECLGSIDPLGLRRGLGDNLEPLGLAVDLRHVENGVGLKETERLCLVTAARLVVHGLVAFAILDNAAPVSPLRT